MIDRLNINWKPQSGIISTWFAMDKGGKIALMLTSCFGDLPKQLLPINNVEELLDEPTDYIWIRQRVGGFAFGRNKQPFRLAKVQKFVLAEKPT